MSWFLCSGFVAYRLLFIQCNASPADTGHSPLHTHTAIHKGDAHSGIAKMHTQTLTHTHIQTHTHTYSNTHTHTDTVYLCNTITHKHIHMHPPIWIHTKIYIHTHAYTHIGPYAFTHIGPYAYTLLLCHKFADCSLQFALNHGKGSAQNVYVCHESETQRRWKARHHVNFTKTTRTHVQTAGKQAAVCCRLRCCGSNG